MKLFMVFGNGKWQEEKTTGMSNLFLKHIRILV